MNIQVTIPELSERLADVLAWVRRDGQTVEIVEADGSVVAILNPPAPPPPRRVRQRITGSPDETASDRLRQLIKRYGDAPTHCRLND